jgi:hypothetical protein
MYVLYSDKPLNWPEGAVEDLSTMCVPSTTRWKASRATTELMNDY